MDRTNVALSILAVLIAGGGFWWMRSGAVAETEAAGSIPPQLAGGHSMQSKRGASEVYVRVFGPDGRLTGPVPSPKVVRSEEEWKTQLGPDAHCVLREQGTERPFSGVLLENKGEGYYVCAACALPLYESSTKFDSGTGWPSFHTAIGPGNVAERVDASHGMVRTETVCARCESHLGHVFEDGPKPTGLRYCMNSASLRFVPASETAAEADPAATAGVAPPQMAEAVFAGGCFWCVEAVFEEVNGVIDAISGYAGGDAASANYRAVSAGGTDHAEAVKIVYDPARVSFEDLLRVHFATHDPTTLNRQGNDVGRQYRSAIFFADDEEKRLAQAFIDDLTSAGIYQSPIVTTLEPLDAFYEAEAYHQNYVCRNPGNPYVRGVSLPKVEKVRKLLKAAD